MYVFMYANKRNDTSITQYMHRLDRRRWGTDNYRETTKKTKHKSTVIKTNEATPI